MAASSVRDAAKELAFHAFEAEFTRNGFPVPEGLIRILREFFLRPGEASVDGRHRIYRRLWALLWYGSNGTLGKDVVVHPRTQPTYVFPQSLKDVVREIVLGKLADHPDPTPTSVYTVKIGDLSRAKWPAAKKAANKRNKKLDAV